MKTIAIYLIGIAIIAAAFQAGPGALANDVTAQVYEAQGQ